MQAWVQAGALSTAPLALQSSGPGASGGPGGDHSELAVRIASLEVENQNLQMVMQDLQQAISRLEARLSMLEKSSPTHRATAPQTQVSTLPGPPLSLWSAVRSRAQEGSWCPG